MKKNKILEEVKGLMEDITTEYDDIEVSSAPEKITDPELIEDLTLEIECMENFDDQCKINAIYWAELTRGINGATGDFFIPIVNGEPSEEFMLIYLPEEDDEDELDEDDFSDPSEYEEYCR